MTRTVVLRGGLDPRPPDEIESGIDWLAMVQAHKIRLRRVLPSEPWVDAVTYRGAACPPPQDHPHGAVMRRCTACYRWTPPQCVGSSGACDDCRIAAMSPMQLAGLQRSSDIIGFVKLAVSVRNSIAYGD